MRQRLRNTVAAALLAGCTGLFAAACGSEETVVRRETYTYMPQPTPAPRVPVTTERTVIERSYGN